MATKKLPKRTKKKESRKCSGLQEQVTKRPASEQRTVISELSLKAVHIEEKFSELQRAKARLDYLASFLEMNPNPVVGVKVDGSIQYLNPAAQQLFPDLQDMGREHEYLVNLESISTLLKNTKTSSVREIRVGNVWFEQTFFLTPMQDQIQIYGRDITRRKQANENREKLEAHIQRLEKMEAIGMMAGGVAHDLNNILSSIVGYPDLILMQLPEDSPLRESVLAIQRSGQKAAAVVQDLLALARRGMVSSEVMNLNSVIFDLMKSPEQGKIQSLYPGVRFEVLLEPDLLPIKGSRVHLSKTVTNLLSNAAESIPEKGVVTISTRNQYLDRPIKGYEEVKEGDYVVFEVTDTGVGISMKDMDKIFEPYYTKKIMGRSGSG